jgi:hypothetical protein
MSGFLEPHAKNGGFVQANMVNWSVVLDLIEVKPHFAEFSLANYIQESLTH